MRMAKVTVYIFIFAVITGWMLQGSPVDPPAFASSSTSGRSTAGASGNSPQDGTSMETGISHSSPVLYRIMQNNTLRVAMFQHDRPPFFYTDQAGELQGSDVDLAQGIADTLGVNLIFDRSAQSFDEVIQQVADGRADLAVSKVSITLPRALKVLYTDPYLVLNQALLINRIQLAKTGKEKRDPVELVNQFHTPVGVMKGTSYVTYAKDLLSGADIKPYEDPAQMMADVESGKLFACFYDENEVKKYIYEKPERSIMLQIAILQNRKDPIAMAAPPEDEHFVRWLNLYLELKGVHPNLDTILKEYLKRRTQP